MLQNTSNSIGEKYNGKLCFFFPFKLKSSVPVFRRFRNEWDAVTNRQRRIVHDEHYPATELLDNKAFIQEREEVLTKLLYNIPIDVNNACAPFATPCLKIEYESSRDDNLFAKEISSVASRFELTCDFTSKCDCTLKAEGLLLFNINLDNMVGTVIFILNFKELPPDRIILLKHHFYKRGLVSIKHSIKLSGPFCPYQKGVDYYNNTNGNTNCKSIETTIQQYVIDNIPWLKYAKSAIDSRARYSLTEISTTGPSNKRITDQLYGILTADPEYQHAHIAKRPISKSSRKAYDFYLVGHNGLIVTKQDKFIEYLNDRDPFYARLKYKPSHYTSNLICKKPCIPGVGKHYYPPFLRAVEISHLINEVLTSEITPQKKSYFNPLTIIRRGYKLWQLIYDLDINKYHISNDIHESFGIDTSMEKIRSEYKDLITHTISYLAVIIASVTLFVTLFDK